MRRMVQVRYFGVSNESSYGLMRFLTIAEQTGLPKVVSIQNSYSLLVRHSPSDAGCLQLPRMAL